MTPHIINSPDKFKTLGIDHECIILTTTHCSSAKQLEASKTYGSGNTTRTIPFPSIVEFTCFSNDTGLGLKWTNEEGTPHYEAIQFSTIAALQESVGHLERVTGFTKSESKDRIFHWIVLLLLLALMAIATYAASTVANHVIGPSGTWLVGGLVILFFGLKILKRLRNQATVSTYN